MPFHTRAHRSHRIFLALLFVGAVCYGQVTLSASASPASAAPGTSVTLLGSGYPAGVTAANTVISIALSGSTSPVTVVPSALQNILGSTYRLTFAVPTTLSVAAPTATALTVASAASTTPPFTSKNSASLTINPNPALVSVSPASAPPGGNAAVQINASYATFGPTTTANFGPGVSVGGAASGTFGPVTVNTGGGSLTVALAIDPSAIPGLRTVTVQNGSSVLSLPNAFTISATSTSSYGITLNSPANPPAGLPGSSVTITGSNFPDNTKTILPGNTTIAIAPAVTGAGPSLSFAASSISGASGTNNTRAVQFSIPSTIAVPSNTPYLITITGKTVDQLTFASNNQAAFALSGVPAGPPVANAGINQTVVLNSNVTLNGAASTDPAGHLLTYFWSFSSIPAGSSAKLSNPTVVNPTFTADKVGSYAITLLVNDGVLGSTPSVVTISTQPAPPIANAGNNQKVALGATVTLDGSGSSDPAGLPLTYSWSFASIPAGSAATLLNPTSVHPTFIADKPGIYTVQLKVNNGYFDSNVSQVVISTLGIPPTANAGGNQTVNVGSMVTLNGAASSDPNGLPLGYSWSLISKPANSTAALVNPATVSPTFVADVYGVYVAQLVVNDGLFQSSPSTVTVSTNDIAPLANAGPNQVLNIGSVVHLDGSKSTSFTGLPLTYSWSLITVPNGSTAQLANPDTVNPSFVADQVGTYVAQLIVSDGVLSSAPANVSITSNDLPPTANAGPNQANIAVGSTVQLDGSGSTDLNGHPLTYAWTILTLPQGSVAALSSSAVIRPTFIADVTGTYVLQLIVSDGVLTSAPATVTISTTAGYPIANAGPNQIVNVGATVTLNGTASSDPNGYSLTYSWTLTATPAGSAATLLNANTAQPMFTVDKAGTYVAQLIVSDPLFSSLPATVTISTNALAPVANAGTPQTVRVGTLVTLDGSASTASSGNPLTYSWSLLSKPAGSTAVLSNATSVNPTFTPDVVGDYQFQLIVNDSIQNSQPATVVISAVLNSIVITSNLAPSTITFAKGTGNVHLVVPATGTAGACNGQVVSISLNNTAVAIISTATANPATSVCVPAGLQDAPFTITTTGTAGSAILTGFAPDFQNGTLSFAVYARQATLSPSSSVVGQGRSLNGVITLTDPAPNAATDPSFPNGVTFTLSTNLPIIATVSGNVTIPAGSTSGAFTVNGLSPGTVNINAAPVTGFSSSVASVTVVPPGQTITIPQNLTVGPGQTLPFPISIGAAAVSPVNVTFSSNGVGSATVFPATVVIPIGATTPAIQPQITGNGIGPVSITASAPNYGPDTETVNVSTTLTFSPNTQNVLTSNTVNYTLSASNVAPAGGFTVNLATADPTKATVPPTVTIPAGQSSVAVTVTGVAAGNTTLQASGVGFVTATAAVVVATAPPTTITSIYCCNLGFNEQYSLSGTIAIAAPAGNLAMTISSTDGTKFLLSTSAAGPFSQAIVVTVPAGSTNIPTFYIQGLASSGAANITTHAVGYGDALTSITMVPTGFYVSGGTTTTTLATPTPVNVHFSQLNPTTLQTQYTDPYHDLDATLRLGASPVTVNLTNSSAAVGTLNASSIAISPGQTGNATAFQPVSAGTANIGIAATPAGYTTPSNYQSTAFIVTAPNLGFQEQPSPNNDTANCLSLATTFTCQVGKDEQISAFAPYLYTAAPAGGRTVTLTSSDPTKALLSSSATVVGSPSITVSVGAGANTGPLIYVQGLASSGTVTITESAPGYNTATGTFTLIPTGFYISGGPSTTTLSPASTITVYFSELNPTTLNTQNTGGNYSYAMLRPGAAPVTVNLTDSSTATGTLGSTSVVVSAGETSNTTTFQPVAAGSANISIAAAPSGYATPANKQSITFTVTAPNLGFQELQQPYDTLDCFPTGFSTTFSCQLGKDEQLSAFVPYLYAAAPAGGRTVTLSSSDPTKALLSTSATAIGTASVIVNIAAGATTGPMIYVQGLTNSGTATITETAPGYNTATGTFTLIPTGFYLAGGTSTTTFSTPSTLYVYFSELNPTSLATQYTGGEYSYAQLRPGAPPVTVNLTNSSAATGTLGSNPVIVSAGQTVNTTTFQPVASGTASIGFAATPAGYTTPSNMQTTAFTVTAPNLEFYAPGPSNLQNCVSLAATFACQLGKDEQETAFFPYLSTAAPTGGRTVTLTSSDPTKVLLSTIATAVGSPSVTVNVAAGSYMGPQIYVQGLTSSGTVTITETASGYNTATGTFTLVPTGFYVPSTLNTTTFSPASAVNVYFSELNPTTLNTQYSGAVGMNATLRPGAAPVTVNLTDSNVLIGTLGSNSVSITAGQTGNATTLQPISSGTANITIAATPAGYTTPSNNQTMMLAVTAPNLGFEDQYPHDLGNCLSVSTTFTCQLGKDEQLTAFAPYLYTAAPAGGSVVTLTSSDPTKALLSTTATAVGSPSVTVNVAAGSTIGPLIYVQGLTLSGAVVITETAPGYNSASGTFSMIPTGVYVSGGASTTTLSPASTIYVSFSELNPTTLNTQATGLGNNATLRPGAASVPVNLTNSNTAVGTLGSSSVTITAGQTGATTTFQPVSAGTANVSIAATPVGYTAASNNQTTGFTVTAPTVGLSSTSVGQNLETTAYVSLAVAPTSATTITLTSADPTRIVLSANATTPGNASLTVALAAGSAQSPTFYVQSLSGAGTVANISISVAAPGYPVTTGSVTINPAGFVFSGASSFTTSVTDNPTTLTVVPSMLDPIYLTATTAQLVRPGLTGTAATITMTDESGTSPVGSITTNPVIFNGADSPNSQTTSFKALNPGVTLLKISSPVGFTSSSSQITATVTP